MKTEELTHVDEVNNDEDLSAVVSEETNKNNEWIVAQVKTPDGKPLNLRSDPDKRGTALTQIPTNTHVSVKDFDLKWVAVKYNGFDGFCMKEFIKK